VSYLRNANERVAYSRTFYPDTEVYINKLGIRDRKLLEATERQLTEDRADEGFPVRAHYRTYAGFKAIHRHLFQDLYQWAGRERNYTTGRGATPFAVPEYISGWMKDLFKQLACDGYLLDGTKKISRQKRRDTLTRSTRVTPSSTATGERNASGFVCSLTMLDLTSILVPRTGSVGTRLLVLASSSKITVLWRG